MSLKVMDGLRTIDGANAGIDIPPAGYTTGTTTNSTGVDMRDFEELLVGLTIGVMTGTGTMTVQIQESNEAAANFTNVSGALVSVAAADDNTGQMFSVDWRPPDRLRYARVQTITANNTCFHSVQTMRVSNKQAVSAEDNMTETT